MNTFKNVSITARRWMLALIGAAVVFSLAFTLPGVSLAAAPTPGTAVIAGDTQLSNAFAREQSLLVTQQTNLDRAANGVTKVQDLISKALGKGADTSALESALATFQEQLATANSSHATAAGILSAHNGFDLSGNVIDTAAARQTVQDARQNLLDCHTALVQGVADLHKAVKSWRESIWDIFQNNHLQKDFQNEQNWLSVQASNLDKTDTVVSRVQELITDAQGKGLDTSALESALATFQNEVATARSSHTTAEGILSAHNGFDGSGNVTDQGVALQTVKDAHQSLLDAHNDLVQALTELKTAVQNWKSINSPSTTPAASTSNG